MFKRYAIFYTPNSGAFADFGSAWLGWDCAAGRAVAHPDVAGLDVAKLSATARKYGFHATLKAPFHLAESRTVEALQDAVEKCAKRHAPVGLGDLELSCANGFLALRPSAEPTGLRALVGAVVVDLDSFRAPLTQDDIARRRRARLTPRQDQQMLDWGYPYVFDDFRFHMTLSARLARDAEAIIMPKVSALVTPILPQSPLVDAITLMGQDADGMFHQIHRAALSG